MNTSSSMPCPHVLHLVISLAPGGLERLVVDWTNARNQRWPGSTRIYCLDEPGEMAGQVERGLVECLEARRAKWPWDHAAVRKLAGKEQLLSERQEGALPSATQQPDNSTTPPDCPAILHAHNLAAWQYAVLAKLFRKASGSRPSLRLIYTQHGANLHNFSMVDRWRARILAFFTDHIVAVSAATAGVMARTLWIPRRRISVVVNGVKARGGEKTVEGLRHKLDIPADAFVIGSVGRLAQVKGHDRLIRAFAEKAVHRYSLWAIGNANNQRPTTNDERPTTNGQRPTTNAQRLTTNPLYLLLAGDGPERADLEKLARELGVSDRVRFVGFQADPQPYLAAMNLFVLPSRSEGLSVSLLEAMAAGIPVAVTDVGANREVVDEGRCGLVLSDDEAEWSSQITEALNDPEHVQAMSLRARERVNRNYSLEATLAGYEALYNC